MAVGVVLVALTLSLLLHPYLSDAFIILFLAAVMIISWFGRLGPGLFSVALSTVVVDYYFILPYHTFEVKFEDVPYFLSFLLSCGCASWLASTRKAAEDKQRVHFEKLFEQGSEGIMLVNAQDRVQRVNAEFVRIFGYTPDEIVGGVSLTFIVPSQLYREALESRTRLSQGESVHLDTVRLRKDGSLVNVSQIAVPVPMDGEQMSYYYLFRDITESKKSAEALQRAHAELVHLSRVTTIGELVASIAHEVNQPTTAISTSGNAALRWLAQDPPKLNEVHDALRNIVRDATRAGEIIGRIRAMVQKSQPRMQKLSMHEVIHGVLRLLEVEIRRGDVRVETEFEEELSAVTGDLVQLQQVILNLIINAIEAMASVPAETRSLKIRASQIQRGILVQVTDSGVGVQNDQVEEIFNPFFTTKSEGLGMGLAISRSIIDAHEGRLWVTPASRDTIFNFTLAVDDTDETI